MSRESRDKFLDDMKHPSARVSKQSKHLYREFMETTSDDNATFALHRDIMTNCGEVHALANAERIIGPEGLIYYWNL